MLQKFMSSFMEPQEGNNNNINNKRRKHVMDVGLRLLIPQITSTSNNNVLVKTDLRKAIIQTQTSPVVEDFCFLKNCNLCNKQLKPDKDIYMYRGDQGFCSIECRNRQIVLDEMKELESSTKQIVKSYNYRQNCCNDAHLETRLILEDLRMQRLKSRV